MRRVAITGQGAFCALGSSADVVVSAMMNGTCAIDRMDFPDLDRLSVQIGAQIKDYDPNTRFTRSEQALYDPFCLLYTSPSPRDKRQSRMPSSA